MRIVAPLLTSPFGSILSANRVAPFTPHVFVSALSCCTISEFCAVASRQPLLASPPLRCVRLSLDLVQTYLRSLSFPHSNTSRERDLWSLTAPHLTLRVRVHH